MAIFNGSAETMNLLKPTLLRTLAAAEWASVMVTGDDGAVPQRRIITIEYYDRDPKTLAEVFRKEQENP